MKYRLFRRKKSNQFFFQILTDGDVAVLDSQGYDQKDARNNGLRSVVTNGGDGARYEKKTEGGQHYFILKAGNGQEIARSVKYGTEGEADSSIALCIKEIPGLAPDGDGAGAAKGGGTTTTTTTTTTTDTTAGRTVTGDTNLVAANRAANVDIDAPPPPKEAKPKKKRKKRKPAGEKKPKKEKVYLANGDYYFNKITYQIFRSGNDKHYFTFKNEAEKTIFLNADVRGFETQAQAEAMVEEVLKYAPFEGNYEGKATRNGKFYFYLNGDDGKRLGKSFFYNTTDDMQAAIGTLLGSEEAIAAAKAASGAPAPAAEAPKKAANIDEYLNCAAYSGAAGWHTFEKDGEFYFSYNDDDGKSLLRSEGYTTEKARDNGIESVKKNAPNNDRWSIVEEDGKWFHALKAGNHQEIGRSCPLNAKPDAMNWGAYSAPKPAPAAKTAVAAPAAKANIDEYLDCAAYKGGSGFHKFEKDGEFYFGYNDDKGNTILRSEGYTTEKARDNGIESVKKNAVIEKRWSTIEEDGKHYRILKAGNHQEIGRSCPSNEASGPAWSWMWGSFAVAAAAAPKVAAPAPEPIKFEKPVVVKVKSETEKEDDYLPCKEYEGHKVTDKINNIALFKHTNGQFYFAVYNKDGSVRLRSEGFQTEKTREEELSGVLKNLSKDDMYKTIKKGNYSMNILYDKTGREVGRSCLIKKAEKAAPVKVAAPVAAAAVVAAAAPKVVKKVEKEDDYLACKEYEGKKINDKTNNVALFKHSDGQFYFAVYNKDKSVRLRSEGFGTSKERDVELSGVLKNLNNKKMYKTIEKGKYKMHVLYDKTGREVGRSCLEKEKKVAPPPPPPPPKKVVPVAAAATAAAATTAKAAAPAAAAKGGCAWWPWLLLLLIPLLICFFTDWCKCSKETPAPAPVEEVAPPPAPEPTPEPEPAPVTCNCSGNSNALFNIPSGRSAKQLTRLGTNPQFGDSHALDAAGFYNKLKSAHAAGGGDARFLDNLFKGMGYGGFGDATAAMFSETTISNGTTGNMGYSTNNKTVYATLNAASSRDLKAFRIDAANGCDMHFMKTCGNHFFFCPN